MTDHDRPAPGDEHPDVTALLAADPAPPIPDDVAARLQAALRAESDARVAGTRPRVTPIEAARRRRRVVPALAAAAVVVAVVAVGGTALVRTGGGGGGSDASSSAEAGGAADRESAPSEPGALAAPEEPGAADGSGGRRLAEAQEAVDTGQAPAALPARPGALTCTADQLDVTSRLAVSYRGDLAWLVTVPGDGADGPEYVVYGCQGDDARRLAVVRPS
ncbi:hypothetical protein [Solicola sp. PLA-1-18]|uniref:hypothetical protein n=1 Tax=Solicola sp. PLA-1-18 TaxID=3380532 RepID=UPI003B784D49